MDALLKDLRFALRNFAHHPGHTLVVVFTLALGIGATSAIFSVIHGVLLADLPFAEGERVVRLRQTAPKADLANLGFSVPDIEDYRQRLEAFDAVVEYHSMPFTFLGNEEPERLQTAVVSADYFTILGIEPELGRTFRPEDDAVGAEPILVLSHGYWQRRFGGDPGVLGTTFEMNDRIHTVVGVLPPLPPYPDDNAIFMPTPSCPFRASVRENRQGRMLTAFARLRHGVSEERAAADLARVSGALARELPDDYPEAGDFVTLGTSLQAEMTRGARRTFLILLTAAGFVLLIVCANVANLGLARLLERRREMAVRVALGASRGRLLRQLVSESMLLALSGAGLGLLLAASTLGLLTDFAARFTPRAQEVALDTPVLLFTLGVAMLTGIVFGALPAFSRGAHLGQVIRQGARTTVGSRLQRGLVAVQVAVSFVLLIAAGLMLQSFVTLLEVDPGFAGEQVVEVTVDLNWTKYDEPQKIRDFYGPLLDSVTTLPGVRSATLGGAVPLGDNGPFSLFFEVEGRDLAPDAPRPQTDVRIVGPGYFETLGIPLAQGRPFNDLDHAEAPPVAIVNQRLAKRYWGDRPAIGRRLTFDQGQTWIEIVGVVPDTRQTSLSTEPGEEVYAPFAQTPFRRMSVLASTTADPASAIRQIRRAVHQIDPRQPVMSGRTLGELRREALSSPRLTTVLIGLFAALALVVTAAGLSGVVAYAVSQRTREIGIRLALGARRREIVRLVMGSGLWMVMVGLGVGLGAALLLARFVRSLLYEVEPTDPLTYAGVALTFVAIAAIACLLPALRAAQLEPSRTLRAD